MFASVSNLIAIFIILTVGGIIGVMLTNLGRDDDELDD